MGFYFKIETPTKTSHFNVSLYSEPINDKEILTGRHHLIGHAEIKENLFYSIITGSLWKKEEIISETQCH